MARHRSGRSGDGRGAADVDVAETGDEFVGIVARRRGMERIRTEFNKAVWQRSTGICGAEMAGVAHKWVHQREREADGDHVEAGRTHAKRV